MHQHHIGNWSDHFLLYIRRGVLVLSVGQEQSHLLHQIHYQGCMSENNHLDHLFYLYLHQRLYHLDRNHCMNLTVDCYFPLLNLGYLMGYLGLLRHFRH